MFQGLKSAPAGTALLVSALMIYPAFTAISVDLDGQSMRFDFQFSLKKHTEEDIHTLLIEKLEKAVRFAHSLMGIYTRVNHFKYRISENVFAASWERDVETLIEDEMDIVNDLLLDFCEEHAIELEESYMDGDAYYHYERVFDELFHMMQEMDQELKLRAYRDMGTIYVHRWNS